jgi:ferredoxin
MVISTARTNEYAEVIINAEACTACGLCVSVCMGGPLVLKNSQIMVDQTQLFGCFACGHCMAVCPEDCITVTGRKLSPDDIFPLPPVEKTASYTSLKALLESRRSVRKYEDRAIPPEVLAQIHQAISTAPMGLPPSDVEVLAFNGKETLQELTEDIIHYLGKIRWFFSPWMMRLTRPFMSKENQSVFEGFLAPAVTGILDRYSVGVNWLTYDAPCALYFYTSAYADPADPIIATTYAMLAAQSLGLGSCMLGTIPYLFKYSKKLRRKYGIPDKSQQGLMLILGYPAIQYRKGITRSLRNIHSHN